MKNLLFTKIILLLIATAFSSTVSAQTSLKLTASKNPGLVINTKLPNVVTSIPQGQVFDLDKKVPKTEQECLKNSTTTTNTAIYKGVNNPVYVTDKGKMFIVLPNKTNTGFYRKYIKL